jgi:hypothetical protein
VNAQSLGRQEKPLPDCSVKPFEKPWWFTGHRPGFLERASCRRHRYGYPDETSAFPEQRHVLSAPVDAGLVLLAHEVITLLSAWRPCDPVPHSLGMEFLTGHFLTLRCADELAVLKLPCGHSSAGAGSGFSGKISNPLRVRAIWNREGGVRDLPSQNCVSSLRVQYPHQGWAAEHVLQ